MGYFVSSVCLLIFFFELGDEWLINLLRSPTSKDLFRFLSLKFINTCLVNPSSLIPSVRCIQLFLYSLNLWLRDPRPYNIVTHCMLDITWLPVICMLLRIRNTIPVASILLKSFFFSTQFSETYKIARTADFVDFCCCLCFLCCLLVLLFK